MKKLFNTRKKTKFKAVDSFLPNLVTIPLKQDRFDECKLLVSVGDTVKEGELLASDSDYTNPLAAKIHSSIPGIVSGVCKSFLVNGEESDAVQIKLQGHFSFRGKKEKHHNWSDLSSEEIIRSFARYGVINTYFINKQSSLASQIKNRNENSSGVVLIRLFDEDPYRITDSFLAENQFEKIRIGAAILAKATKAKGIIFAHDKDLKGLENKEEEFKLFGDIPVKYCSINSSKYPSGFQRELIEIVLKEISDSTFPKINIYDLITDSVTLLHVYEAAELNKPTISQYVYVTGDCLKSSGVFNIPLGITLDFLAQQCGGFLKQPKRIILNGQLSGWTAAAKDIPVTKDLKSIYFCSSMEIPHFAPHECVRCGKCRAVCPAGLSPDLLFNQMKYYSDNMEPILVKASTLCSGCALCNSVCSSRLPLAQTIELIKDGSYEKLFSN